ncbi:hypothetical protein [Propioniciclava soli]|uniref:XRE family transcriptional regulator n=1 Tax=Propioniciclava soli TaxID=2775081 RepID=A0ABZ3C9J0_9ACTN|nr:hypothetical protein [Propioniciclava soli]
MNAENRPGSSFAEVLTAAVQSRGLSLERLRSRLDEMGVPVSIATLSYWQSGRSLPTRARSYHTLVALEDILELPSGHLTRHTHTADGRTRRELFPWQSVMPVGELVTQIIADLGIDMQGQLARVSMVDRLTINADRTEAMQEGRILWRADRNGLHRWPLVFEQDADGDSGVPTLEATFGCRVGEVVEVPERHLIVAEMLAPRVVQRGEHVLSEYRVLFAPTSAPSFRLTRSSMDPVRTVALCTRFDPHELPRRVRGGYSATMGAEPTEFTDLELTDNEAQFVRADTSPGVHAMTWEWD